MYIDSITLQDFRTFERAKIDFLHPDRSFDTLNLPRPKWPNVNLLLGNNGLGKTTLLKAISIAALGPAIQDARLPIYYLIRRRAKAKTTVTADKAFVEGLFTSHEQDGRGTAYPPDSLESRATISRIEDTEILRWSHRDEKTWHPIYSEHSDAFFFVGYGANRRVEQQENVDLASRRNSPLLRAERVRSLFEESYSLVPMSSWLPRMKDTNRGRFVQIKNLINRLLKGTPYSFEGDRTERGEYLFHRRGMTVPFRALSDGLRAYLGWIGDLLYHVCRTCPSGKKLVENRGIVMVDEIDLHLHPKWQLTVVPTLAAALPNLQFIVTTHSPLIVGSLEWTNIILVTENRRGASIARRIGKPVHGLDADQVLLTEYFGMQSTRVPGSVSDLKALSLRAGTGDPDAAKQLLDRMSHGQEATR